jgi:AraC family transcriptional regulator
MTMPSNQFSPAPHFGTFYGEVTRRRELKQLILTETTYPPGYSVPVHKHDLSWFGFVLEGSLTEIHRNKTLDCKPFTLLYRLGDESHSNRSGRGGSRCVTVEMKRPFFADVIQSLGILRHSAEFNGGLLPKFILGLYEEFMTMDSVSPLSIEGLVLELLAEAHRRLSIVQARVPSGRVRQAMELVHARFTENLSLSEIASEVGSHPVHLARAFRKCYGHPIGGYIRKLRVEHAYHDLITTDLSLVEIALASGFCDQAHFSRTFKRIMGIKPSELRMTLRGRSAKNHTLS